MTARVLIGKMRNKLNDEASEWWSDDELLDDINTALSAVAVKLVQWQNTYEFTTLSGSAAYALPNDFMSPEWCEVGGVPTDILSKEKAYGYTGNAVICVFDGTEIILMPTPESTETVIVGYKGYKVYDFDDEIELNAVLTDALKMYALSLAYQKQPSEDALKKSGYFLKLYKDRVADVSKIASERVGTQRIRSTYQKV